jgi:hypothetical protein
VEKEEEEEVEGGKGGRTKLVSQVEGVSKAVEPFDATGKGIR